MDITKLTVVELKALAYDELAKMEVAQNNLKTINQELAKRSQPAVEEKPVEEKVEEVKE